jgi:predicted O-methyltransferase YrrM
MTRKTLAAGDLIDAYIEETTLRETDVLRRLREETERHPRSRMLLNPVQGQFMALLAKATGVKRALEIGTFTGYSSLCVAAALPPDGKLVCCDIDADLTAIARRYWAEAGLADKIALHIGPAAETLAALLDTEGPESFDFIFIDADKANYETYYELSLKLVRRGGLVLCDNVLRNGWVATDPEVDRETILLRALNEKLGRDERIDVSLLPIADGLTICRKR